ncbi:MAG TPA: NADH-quinone oxidoreductase subunit A [Candidatus Acidoferrum sp.]|nr:NADH-quinone oxidoreductase subunit A [Candidatus Acidoferrum sp.]
MNIDLWPLLIYSVIVIVLICALLVASSLLGQRRKDHATHDVYESGIVSTGSANLKIAVPFYLTAILFIIFDLEAAFLFAWAISIREAGWVGYIEVVIFIGILIAGLLYLWKAGALEWRTLRQQRDLANLKGEGGVVNVGRKAASNDTHHGQHDDHHGASHGDSHAGAHDAHGHGGAH